MQRKRRIYVNQAIVVPILIMGFFCVIFSAVYTSSYLAILGVSFIFWGSILLYVTPSKQIPITFLTASITSNTSNMERLLTELKYDGKAVYLSPKNLKDAESSLIIIPKIRNQTLPQLEEMTLDRIFDEQIGSLFLTPPGSGLTKIFEQKLGESFTKIDLRNLEKTLSKLLVEDLGIMENLQIEVNNNKIIIEVNGNILEKICLENEKYPYSHNSIGCLLSSSLACVLAKTSGKCISIENEEHPNAKTTKISYQILEE
jgi:hypothetical protein